MKKVLLLLQYLRYFGVANNLVFIDILTFADAFYKGLDQFLIEMFVDEQKRQVIELRLNEILTAIPYIVQKP